MIPGHRQAKKAQTSWEGVKEYEKKGRSGVWWARTGFPISAELRGTSAIMHSSLVVERVGCRGFFFFLFTVVCSVVILILLEGP